MYPSDLYAGPQLPSNGRRARVRAQLSPQQRDTADAGDPLPLQTGYMSDLPRYITSMAEREVRQRDPDLHIALQDLADAIVKDLTQACYAFDDPELWYPGVDDGIEPVTDEHVELVIWASQRELNRELRRSQTTGKNRPAAPLDELPWRIKRAFAERRRLRYQQWGIGREEWKANAWYLQNVPLDEEWSP